MLKKMEELERKLEEACCYYELLCEVVDGNLIKPEHSLAVKLEIFATSAEIANWEKALEELYDKLEASGEISFSGKKLQNDFDNEWKKEIAIEAGMLHGINTYNEAMSY
jgi:hypothetical protein